jgi:2-oxoglutarate ferredoxin oxidoreductase subunit alpha
LRKLAGYDFGDRWADLDGDPDDRTLIICWGSVSGSASEARRLLAARGIEVSVLTVRLLAPLPADLLRSVLDRAKMSVVVEQNHGAQFCHYLRAQLPGYRFDSMAVPGPKLITPRQIIDALEGLSP